MFSTLELLLIGAALGACLGIAIGDLVNWWRRNHDD
jgi:ABC-type nitrate/sulfonate/bicarbonate transport system permease component